MSLSVIYDANLMTISNRLFNFPLAVKLETIHKPAKPPTNSQTIHKPVKPPTNHPQPQTNQTNLKLAKYQTNLLLISQKSYWYFR